MGKTATLETRQKLFDTLKKHNANISVFDNGGETVGRYTIYFDINSDDEYNAQSYIVTSSASPSEPSGFWQRVERWCDPMHKDQRQRISALDLPEAVLLQIIKELEQN